MGAGLGVCNMMPHWKWFTTCQNGNNDRVFMGNKVACKIVMYEWVLELKNSLIFLGTQCNYAVEGGLVKISCVP